jgi:predicted ArsR family transcriptional regulator
MRRNEAGLRPEQVHEVVLFVRKELQSGAKPKDSIASELMSRFRINKTEAYQELGFLIDRGVVQAMPVLTGKSGRPTLMLCIVEQK